MGGSWNGEMNRETAVTRLRRHAPELRAEGVAALYLFGSTVRGEAREASDVELFFDYDSPKFSLIELVRIMTRDSLHPMVKERIEASAIRVF